PTERSGWTANRLRLRPRPILPFSRLSAMTEGRTTAVVQRYLDERAGDAPAEPIVGALRERSAGQMQLLCANFLHWGYPRLTRPPLNWQPDEVVGGLVKQLLKALRSIRPQTVRQFFALANQHTRWEWNDLARRLEEQPHAAELREGLLPAPESSGAGEKGKEDK